MGVNSSGISQAQSTQPTLTVPLPRGAKLFPVGMFLIARVNGYAADGKLEIQTDKGALLANTPFVFKKGYVLQLVVRESSPQKLVLQLLVPQDMDDPQLEVLVAATGLSGSKDIEQIALGLLNRRVLINKSILQEAAQLMQDLPTDVRERALDIYTLLIRAGVKLESKDLIGIVRTAILEPTLSSSIGPLLTLLQDEVMRSPLLEAVLKDTMVKLGIDFANLGANKIHNALVALYTSTPYELSALIIEWLVKKARERQEEQKNKLSSSEVPIQEDSDNTEKVIETKTQPDLPVPPSQLEVSKKSVTNDSQTQTQKADLEQIVLNASSGPKKQEQVEITLRNLEVLLRTLIETPQMQADPKLLYHVQLLLDQLIARQLLMALQPDVRRFSLPIELADEQFDAEIEVRDFGKEGYKDSKLIRIYIPSERLGVIEALINLQGPVISLDLMFERDETLKLYSETETSFEQHLKASSVYVIRRVHTSRIPEHAVNIFGDE